MSDTKAKRGKVTDENREESRRLKALWDKTYNERKDAGLHSQGAFGAEYGIGGQAVVGFFLNGKTAISLKAAKGFARGLGCQIGDFSPRLAAMESSWPFELVDRARYEALTPAQRYQAQVRMMDEIKDIERACVANGTTG